MLLSGMFILPSKFGYIITGKCPDTKESLVNGKLGTLFVGAEVSQVIPELCSQYSLGIPVMENPQLENLWSPENIGISDPSFVMRLFRNSMRLFDQGCY